MLFAGLLGARKKVPIWRIGRAQAWMRGHLWLGFLSFPLILFHSGFRFGVGLTRALMWLYLLVFVSGIVGAILQHFMPRLTTQRIPLETIYEQIGRVRSQLASEAADAGRRSVRCAGWKCFTSHRAAARRLGERRTRLAASRLRPACR